MSAVKLQERTKLDAVSKALTANERKNAALVDIKFAIELHKNRIYNF